MNKRAIVTGVAGFIGAHVAQELIDREWQVLGIDDLSGGVPSNVPAGVDFHARNICEPLDDIFRPFSPHTVIHLAAYAAEGLSHHIPCFNYQNNLIGTSNVLNAAFHSDVEHFVFTSSIAAYGHPKTSDAFSEDTPCTPCDPYGIAKYACENHIKSFANYYGGPHYTIIRPHNVFGPKQNIADPFRNVVGIFFRCLELGRPLPVFGDGGQSRCFSYVDLVAKCIASASWAATARNQVFNVGGDRAITVMELAELMQQVTGKHVGIQHLAPRNEVKHAVASHDKAKQVFADAFEDAISIQQGLERTAEYLKGRPIPQETPCPAPIEVINNLPNAWKDKLK